MTTWYTSDLHLGHRMVASLRGFDNPDDHDAAVAANWDAVVGKNDVVWVLGDLTLGSVDAACSWIQARAGRKRLVFGNHDKGHPMNTDVVREARRYADAFEWTGTFARRRYGSLRVMLSHFPYTEDHTAKPRHMQYRLPDLGMPLLHGHTHSADRVTAPGQVHVGLDAWNLIPVREDVVMGLL